jgi:hypothetical protein
VACYRQPNENSQMERITKGDLISQSVFESHLPFFEGMTSSGVACIALKSRIGARII